MADDDNPQAQVRVEDKLVGPASGFADWLGISMKAFSHLAETRVAVPITRGKYLLKATVRNGMGARSACRRVGTARAARRGRSCWESKLSGRSSPWNGKQAAGCARRTCAQM